MRRLGAVLGAAGAVGALGYAVGRVRPVRKARDAVWWRLRVGPVAPESWPPLAREVSIYVWSVVVLATEPRQSASRLWRARHPDPDAVPVDVKVLLDPAERAARRAEIAAERARPIRVEYSRVHAPWWEPRHGVQIAGNGRRSAREAFWTAWGARRAGRKALRVAQEAQAAAKVDG